MIKVTDILPPPFEWCQVEGGAVDIEDASEYRGSKGGRFEVKSFLMAKYPITNAQYQVCSWMRRDGYRNEQWWLVLGICDAKWHKGSSRRQRKLDIEGENLPRTNVNLV